jgi:hypothetical protein
LARATEKAKAEEKTKRLPGRIARGALSIWVVSNGQRLMANG